MTEAAAFDLFKLVQEVELMRDISIRALTDVSGTMQADPILASHPRAAAQAARAGMALAAAERSAREAAAGLREVLAIQYQLTEAQRYATLS